MRINNNPDTPILTDNNGATWRVSRIHGRQFLNGEEYVALVHVSTHTITVSDAFPIDQQLEAAAMAAQELP